MCGLNDLKLEESGLILKIYILQTATCKFVIKIRMQKNSSDFELHNEPTFEIIAQKFKL